MRGPIRVGIIGAGYVAEAYHLPVLKRLEGRVRLEWLCDTRHDRAAELARISGIGRAATRLAECSEVDAVLVAVPPGARREVMEQVLQRRWHALCEKPFAANLSDHHWILSEARRRGVRLSIGLVRRYYSSTETARKLVGSRLLGSVSEVIAGEGQRVQKTGRGAGWYQADATASGGGVLAETGTHLIDQVVRICGARRVSVDAVRQERVNGLEFETIGRATIELSERERVPLSFRVTRLRDIFNGIVVRCENGEVRLGLTPDAPLELRDKADDVVCRVPSPVAGLAALSFAIRREWEAFLDGIESGPDFQDEETGLMTASLIDECYRRSSP